MTGVLRFFTRYIGWSVSCNLFLPFTENIQGAELDAGVLSSLEALRFHTINTKDYVFPWSETVMFVRFISKHSSDWRQKLSAYVRSIVESTLSKVVERLMTIRSADNAAIASRQILDDKEFRSNIWEVIGALSYIGGFVDAPRVGCRVFNTSDGSFGTVVLMNKKTWNSGIKVWVVKDGDSKVGEVPIDSLVPVGDLPFTVSDFNISSAQVLESVIGVLEQAALEEQQVADYNKQIEEESKNKKESKIQKELNTIRGISTQKVHAFVQPNAANVVLGELRARCARVFHAFLQSQKSVVEFAQLHPKKFALLLQLAKQNATDSPTYEFLLSSSVVESSLRVLNKTE
eukprot:TRINITY_DN2612_c1_g1_i4.p1 TRINITY_DN2612_c1_g1~~TRINITY_DN2612_c1_g1_i4.p1  ORF type:complete len:345 (-),score=90.33 TRINITY_DN2612_c1_g1_i4:45-1079(-)